ncbi:MFS transporter [Nocardioides bruguierae]|uniref:MFS transporter n=1 Tax=Nocardioides bruguierae TaxID=2945102 RepID=A0A9X2D3Y0_9ACTN|nr:MFS transporter [Nocardioides bruguierae]MCM0618795.1 MFS transporter [Nocardioides bruguierae]
MSAAQPGPVGVPRKPVSRGTLALATVAVGFTAADTYVVVLALVDMMQGVGLSPDQLQRAAPIISGFLLGYVAILPLIGRLADMRGRLPVLSACLIGFALGSLVTGLAPDMPTLVTGRFLQGVGAGGLVPATLALVADRYPPERRGLPLGLVSGAQETGALLGPLLGAAVLAVADWRVIFALNLVVGLGLAVLLRWSAGPVRDRRRPDRLSAVLLVLLTAGVVVLWYPPGPLYSDLTVGLLWVPLVPGGGDWVTPLGLVVLALAVGLVVRLRTAADPLLDVRGWAASLRQADVSGALLLAAALGAVVLAFSTTDPKLEAMSARGWWFLALGAAALAGLVFHLRRSPAPLVPRGALRHRAAWGSLVVSLLIGGALIAALVDVPIFARTTIYPDSQLGAALVLVRFLVTVPVGAVVGGWLVHRLAPGPVAATGMVLAALSFVAMARWDAGALESWASTAALLVGGLGFGLAVAPVTAAVLDATPAAVHGLAASLAVVARSVGMLLGASGLTTLGLRRYYALQADLPDPATVCADGTARCDAWTDLLREAALSQERTVFAGAAVLALLAAVGALVLLRGTRAPAGSVLVGSTPGGDSHPSASPTDGR